MSSLGALGGSTAAGLAAGSSAGGAGAGSTDTGAPASSSAPQPNGAASLLGALYAGATPVHPHLDDASGGYLDAYAAADHTHPKSASAVWRFSTQLGTGDPGAGNLRCDTGDLNTATVLYVSGTTEGGTEFPRVDATLGLGDRIYVPDQNDNSRFQGFDLTGDGVHLGGYSTYPVTQRVGAVLPIANNQTVAVAFEDVDGGGEAPAGGETLPHTHTDASSGDTLDYVRLVVSATLPPTPAAPSDALWLNPTEVA